MKTIAVIDAPSILGLRESGVEKLPDALKAHGLLEKLGAIEAGKVVPPPYNPQRDKLTKILNPQGIRDYSIKLADVIEREHKQGVFPLVLGGDCSILIGCLLALRRQGKYGLFFLDGHADFYQPSASLTGEVADMDLAIVTGRGPEILTNIENLKPLMEDANVVAFGYRDTEDQKRYGSQDITKTDIYTLELKQIRAKGLKKAANEAFQYLLQSDIEGFWIHLDADVLDDTIMPAVDYRQPGGLTFGELSYILSLLLGSQKAMGMSISVFNPALDKDGMIARNFVLSLETGFKAH